MKKLVSFFGRGLKRLVALPFILLSKGFFTALSLLISLLSIKTVRQWIWKRMKTRTKKRVTDIEGEVKKRAKRRILGD